MHQLALGVTHLLIHVQKKINERMGWYWCINRDENSVVEIVIYFQISNLNDNTQLKYQNCVIPERVQLPLHILKEFSRLNMVYFKK